ncbi:MAG: hypothetical protein L0170_09865 [Acidobacteria bacterium]|nr:hypothetical protein [Acidobacteriota bacterium]
MSAPSVRAGTSARSFSPVWWVLLPVCITLWLPSALFRLVDGAITPWVQRILTC